MTSAPMPASRREMPGAAATLAKSRTRRPDRGGVDRCVAFASGNGRLMSFAK